MMFLLEKKKALSKSEHGLEMLKVLNLQLLILWEIEDLLVLSFLAATPARRGLCPFLHEFFSVSRFLRI